MSARLRAAIVATAAALAPAAAAPAQDAPTARASGGGKIASIEIEVEDVFDLSIPENRENPLYQAANALHVETRPWVVRQVLLFDEGDRFDPEALAETERYLRAQPQYQAVTVTATARLDGDYDVRVTVRDKWTLAVGVGAGFVGGVSKGSFVLSDSNFLGLGKSVGLFAQLRSDRAIVRGTYFDPNLAGSRIQLFLSAAASDLGTLFTGSIGQPFYARDTPYAWSVQAARERSDVEYFRDGDVVAEVRQEIDAAGVSGGLGFGPRDFVKRIEFAFDFERALYDAPEGDDPLSIRWPRNRDTYDIVLTPSIDRFGTFRKRWRIDADRIVEDIEIGWRLAVFGGPQIRDDSRGTRLEGIFGARGLWSFEPFEKHVAALAFDWSMRHDGEATQARSATWSVKHYARLGDWQTLAWNVDFTLLDEREDLTPQLTLGEDNGLRGYEAREFAGTRRLRVNVEDRIFTEINLLSFYLGFVVFADAGVVWDAGDRLSWDDVKPAVGFGFRVFSAEFLKRNVGRLDIAFPLDPEKGFGVSVSVSAGQVFTLFGRRDELAARF